MNNSHTCAYFRNNAMLLRLRLVVAHIKAQHYSTLHLSHLLLSIKENSVVSMDKITHHSGGCFFFFLSEYQ